ncbi:spermine synthase-like isoform X2 [Macrosteles quadrilineatus]|uniref:spermine synthase-like isoform X2 n=1 Tax=Macrosteles quadrilineatus TaxID=74068 RepID=UPI0023E1BCBE|nr:spermine synthase-like isoform X2 [Macrosteles quadrilineatus]
MAVNTILLDLTVDPQKIVEKNGLKSAVQDVLSKFIPELKEVYTSDFQGGGTLYTFTAVRDSFITVRAFTKGVISINIEYYREDSDEPLLSFEKSRSLDVQLRFALSATRSKLFPPIRRGARFDVYLNSSDERILEYDIDAVVFEEQSPYQKVQIVHSKSLGNLLVLDELQNLSERDLIYTETLMQRGKEDYAGKEIVILGGGDGALLYELLKEKPKFVTMLELDEVVIRACREHLRGCCGDILDQLEGLNYKIVIDDCVKSLDQMIAEGKKVDYVFGDLTDIPVSVTPQGEVWDFIRLILNKAMQVIKPSGKYLTHGNGVSSPKSLAMFEDQLRNLQIPVDFTRDTAFVPSFLEDWVFYQVWPKLVN